MPNDCQTETKSKSSTSNVVARGFAVFPDGVYYLHWVAKTASKSVFTSLPVDGSRLLARSERPLTELPGWPCLPTGRHSCTQSWSVPNPT